MQVIYGMMLQFLCPQIRVPLIRVRIGCPFFGMGANFYCPLFGGHFTSDVREYMNDFMTTEFIAERYSSILDVAEPMCIDVNDELYIKNEPKSGGFSFSDTDPTIEKNFEDGYSILAAYDNFGAEETMDIRVINDDGIWKICGVTFGL